MDAGRPGRGRIPFDSGREVAGITPESGSAPRPRRYPARRRQHVGDRSRTGTERQEHEVEGVAVEELAGGGAGRRE